MPHLMRSFPRAIIHIDGDAFFASCEQARNPKLRGKPVITGKERGIAASMSYEAKAMGVTRGMSLHEIKRVCPDVVMLPSDYETYSLLSKRFFTIVKKYTPEVEEYSIDECFADITGLRRVLRMGYPEIAAAIKKELDVSLGFTFSVGLGPNKSIAKIGSKWKKPSGLTVISAPNIPTYLEKLSAEKVWGIGHNTAEHLARYRITTALQFARKNEEWVRATFSKPFQEIWRELNGEFVFKLETEPKTTYYTISKTKTFTPPSEDRKYVFSQLSKNIENACIKARRYKLAATGVTFYLRQQDFRHTGIELKLSRLTAIPSDLINLADEHFDEFFKQNTLYRATGVSLLGLQEDKVSQLDLFGEAVKMIEKKKLYEAVDAVNKKYGKHTLYLGSSFLANKYSQHLGERGDIPERKQNMFRGETKRKRLGIPMFSGE
jgi:DNA polymerase IV